MKLIYFYIPFSLACISYLSYDYNKYIEETRPTEIERMFEIFNEAEKAYLISCYKNTGNKLMCKIQASEYVSELTKQYSK